MMPLQYKVLNVLINPMTTKEVANDLNVDVLEVSFAINKLIGLNKVKVWGYKRIKVDDLVTHKRTVYKSENKDKYMACSECRNYYLSNTLIDYVCNDCYVTLNSDYYSLKDLSVTSFNYMQNIINEQKQLIYKLKIENHILKKGKL